MAALEAHFAHEWPGGEIDILDVSPKVLQWLRARYPERRFIPKGRPFGITGAPIVRTNLSADFDAGKQRCRVVIDSVMGPVGAVTFEYTLKRDPKGCWRVVARTVGPVA